MMQIRRDLRFRQSYRDEVGIRHPEVCDEVSAQQPGGGKNFPWACGRYENSADSFLWVTAQGCGGEKRGWDAGQGDITKLKLFTRSYLARHDHGAGLLTSRGQSAHGSSNEQHTRQHAANEHAASVPRCAQDMNKFHTFLDCAVLHVVPEALQPTHPALSEDAIDGTVMVFGRHLTYLGGMHECHYRRAARR